MSAAAAVDAPLAPLTTLRLGGPAKRLVGVASEAELVQVDQLVDISKALLGRFSLVQSGSAGGVDARTDQADEHGRWLVLRHGPG